MKIDKIIRFIVIEPQFKIRVGLFIILLFTIFILSQLLANKKTTLKKTIDDKKLVESIPRMEAIIQGKIRPTPVARPKVEIKREQKVFKLDGISYFEGVPYAVINDEVYKVGDLINNHSVYEIKDDYVVLKHRFTGAIRELYLKPFDIPIPKP